MDIPKTLFATLVKQGRMEMHLTQEALAEKLGIRNNTDYYENKSL